MQFEKVHTKRILAFLNSETMNISDGRPNDYYG